MRGLNKFDDGYFQKYRTTPVHIKPFSPKQTKIAEIIIDKLKEQLKDFDIKYLIRGSTAFKIAGKGEVEVGVYPQPNDWQKVLKKLTEFYGPMENQEESYARVNSQIEDTEIEIIILKEHEADVDISLHRYLIDHPQLLQDYEDLKKDNCYSKRQYMIAKNKFLTEVVESVPDNY